MFEFSGERKSTQVLLPEPGDEERVANLGTAAHDEGPSVRRDGEPDEREIREVCHSFGLAPFNAAPPHVEPLGCRVQNGQAVWHPIGRATERGRCEVRKDLHGGAGLRRQYSQRHSRPNVFSIHPRELAPVRRDGRALEQWCNQSGIAAFDREPIGCGCALHGRSEVDCRDR